MHQENELCNIENTSLTPVFKSIFESIFLQGIWMVTEPVKRLGDSLFDLCITNDAIGYRRNIVRGEPRQVSEPRSPSDSFENLIPELAILLNFRAARQVCFAKHARQELSIRLVYKAFDYFNRSRRRGQPAIQSGHFLPTRVKVFNNESLRIYREPVPLVN